MNSFIFGGNTGIKGPKELAKKRQLANALAARATRTPRNVGEGINSIGQAILARQMMGKADTAEKAGREGANSLVSALLSGQRSTPATPSADPSGYRDAIASIESAGSGDYSALGPATKSGDRAYGRYQVMGANLPSWTREALGKELTPEQFIASPEAQDAVFDHRFGGYVKKHGNAQDAASMWFTGRPQSQGGDAKDILGTSGNQYVEKFNKALGGNSQSSSQAQGINPKLIEALNNPYLNDGQRTVVGTLLQQQLKANQPRSEMETLQLDKLRLQNDQLRNPIPKQKRIVQGADGFQYFEDGSRVLPGIEKQDASQFRQISGDEAQAMGLDPSKSYNVGPKGRVSQIGGNGTSVTVNNQSAPDLPAYPKLDKGFVYQRDEKGNVLIDERGSPSVIPITGSAAEQERIAQGRAQEAKAENQKKFSGIVVEDIDRAVSLIEKGEGLLPTTGAVAPMTSQIGGTDSHQLSQYLNTIKANAAFDRLQAMRDASPTGGALGSVSEMEMGLLQAAIGSLEQSQSKEELLHNLKRVRTIYSDIIHGPQQDKPEIPEGVTPEEWGAMTEEDKALFR